MIIYVYLNHEQARKPSIDVQHSPTPVQPDDWSCGHRLLLQLQDLVRQGLCLKQHGLWLQDIDSLRISKDSVSEEKIKDMSSWLPAMSVVPTRARWPFHVLTSRPIPSPLRSSRGQHSIKLKQETTPCGIKEAEMSTTTGSTGSMVKPDVIDSKTWRAEVDKELQAVKVEISQDSQSLVSAATERQESVRSKRALKRHQDQAKQIVVASGLCFNTHFQKAHSMRLPQGHWAKFLDAVMGTLGDDLDCQHCRDLLRRFDIEKRRSDILQKTDDQCRQEPAADPVPMTQPAEPEIPNEQCVALVPFENQSSEPAYKKRRGRPRKGEVREFNILDFLETERVGLYRILSRDEACYFYCYFFIYFFLLVIVILDTCGII